MLIFNDNMLTLYTEGRIYVVQLYIKAISLDLANVNVKSKKYLVGGGESGGQERQNMRKKGEGEQRCVTGHNYFLTKKNISPALSAHPRPQLAHGFSLLRFVTLNNWMPLWWQTQVPLQYPYILLSSLKFIQVRRRAAFVLASYTLERVRQICLCLTSFHFLFGPLLISQSPH